MIPINKYKLNDATRLFFVVINPDTNEEIFETLGEAQSYINNKKQIIWIALVNHAYKEHDYKKSDKNSVLKWNYNDLADTFQFIRVIE